MLLPLVGVLALLLVPALGEPASAGSSAALGGSSGRSLDQRITSRDFMIRAASVELLAIRSAELAAQRSWDGKIRSAAVRSLREHTGLSTQLAYAGRRLNLLPAATLLPEHERVLVELINSADIDTAYVRQRRAAARSAYRLYREYFGSGSSPTLRLVAARGMEVWTSEINRLRRP